MGVMCRAKRSRCMYLPQDNSYALNDRDNPQRMMDISPSTSWEGNIYHNSSLMGGNGFRLSGDGDYTSSEFYLSESESDSSETGQNTFEGTTSLSGVITYFLLKIQLNILKFEFLIAYNLVFLGGELFI